MSGGKREGKEERDGEGDGVVVSGTLWGRGVPAEGSNGKVNISDKGFEFSVGVSE